VHQLADTDLGGGLIRSGVERAEAESAIREVSTALAAETVA
jgi:hypothetical protein